MSSTLLDKLIAEDGVFVRTKKEINIQIGEQIKLAREQARMTQEQLAESVSVSPQYISDLERGVVGLSIPTLKHICLSLRVSSDRILFGSVTEKRGVLLEETCRVLSYEQFAILTEIVCKYVEALKLK